MTGEYTDAAMPDIVERLQATIKFANRVMDAKDTEIDRLKAALREIAQDDTEGVGVFQVIARRALEGKP
jgi:hypothetical protein